MNEVIKNIEIKIKQQLYDTGEIHLAEIYCILVKNLTNSNIPVELCLCDLIERLTYLNLSFDEKRNSVTIYKLEKLK
jgi:hypothetical protein